MGRQHHGVIVDGVSGCIEQVNRAMVMGIISQLRNGWITRQLRQVSRPEIIETFGLMVKSGPQLRGGRNIFEPDVYGGSFLADTPRPQPVYQDAKMTRDWLVIDAPNSKLTHGGSVARQSRSAGW